MTVVNGWKSVADNPVSLMAAALTAPLIGVMLRWPNTRHAITMESVIKGWDRGRFESACGFKGLAITGAYVDDRSGPLVAAPWPPRLKGLSGVRCRKCWDATGRMRPRTESRRVSPEVTR